MAQLDKIIKVMLDRSGAEIILVAGAEPYLRAEGVQPHVLINRKLAPPHLRMLLQELVGDAALPELESADGGDYSYNLNGTAVSVAVRSWTGNVEARIGRGGKRAAAPAGGAAVARIELTKAPSQDLRRAATNPATEARAAARAPEPMRYPAGEGIELDLGSGVVGGSIGSRGMPAAPASHSSDLELDLSAPMPPEPYITSSSGRVQAASPVVAFAPPEPRASEPMRAAAHAAPAAPVGEPAINALFRVMIKTGASDLHLSTGERAMIRRDGDIARLDDKSARFKGTEIMDLLRPILPANNLAEFEREHDTDFAYEIEGLSRFRGNVFLDRRGVGAVFRTIPTEIVTAEKLGLATAIQNLCYLSKGLVLVTGPTGSGKSTTLCALIDLINRSRHDHVITIEDPIEFVHQNKLCLINQRQVGPHTDGFKRALRAALREDPDVVMVGEMRDLETMAIAMETAETGHLVFGTLHTSTSYSTVDRVIDSFPADRQAQIRVMLSESLKGVVSQTLCKKIGGGRVAAYEILLVTSAVSNLIREGKTFQIPSIMQTARKQGMVLLNDALLELVQTKKVEVKEAYIKSIDKGNFVSALRAAGHKLEFLGPG
jgi:twitching motility protein PilT